MKAIKNFASDNNASVHEKILEALADVNKGHALAYGDDPYTASAIHKFEEVFGANIDVHFVYNGTGANVLGLSTVTSPYNAILCAESAHINVDECGASEKFTGCKLVTVPSADGKIRVEQIERHLHVLGVQHHSQPKVISITQSTEYGTVYAVQEIKEIADIAHGHGLYLHMDGARIANAAAALNTGLKEITGDAGIDILSFGGTKNGLMYGEAVVFFNKELGKNFKFIRKNGMQLASKMRYISAQFQALLTDGLWLKNARHANSMARLLANKAKDIPGVEISSTVEANAVFAVIPGAAIPRLQERFFFYVWNEEKNEVRWMASFDTTEEDVNAFVEALREAVKPE